MMTKPIGEEMSKWRTPSVAALALALSVTGTAQSLSREAKQKISGSLNEGTCAVESVRKSNPDGCAVVDYRRKLKASGSNNVPEKSVPTTSLSSTSSPK